MWKFYVEIKAYNRQLSLYPEVRNIYIYIYDTIAYKRIKPLTYQMMLWSLECALPKIWRAKSIEHNVSHIMSTEEEFLSFCEQIDIQKDINRPHKTLNRNTGDSSKK